MKQNNTTTKPLNENKMAEEAKMALLLAAVAIVCVLIGALYNERNEKKKN